MTEEQKPRPIDLKTIDLTPVISGPVTPEMVGQLVAENEELYRTQIEELGKQYGGTFVTDKRLYRSLLHGAKSYRQRKGVLPDVMRPPNYPAEEFIPIVLSFNVHALGISVDKTYFIRRNRVFAVGGRG